MTQEQWTELFEQGMVNNQRTAVRFVREDIKATVKYPGLLDLNKTIPVGLLDISSKGVLIASAKKLAVNKKTTLTLEFKTGRIFKIKGIITRCSSSAPNEYAIKFASLNNELGDYLVETQEKLIFK